MSGTQIGERSQNPELLKTSRGNGFEEVAHIYGEKLLPVQRRRVATHRPESLLTRQKGEEQNPAIAGVLGTRAVNTEREGPEE